MPLLLQLADSSMQLVLGSSSAGSSSTSQDARVSAIGRSASSLPPGLAIDSEMAVENASSLVALISTVLAQLTVPQSSLTSTTAVDSSSSSSSTAGSNGQASINSTSSSSQIPHAVAPASALLHQSVLAPLTMQFLQTFESFIRLAAGVSVSDSDPGDPRAYINRHRVISTVEQFSGLFSKPDAPLVLLVAGADSREHQQLFSFLASFLKFGSAVSTAGSMPPEWASSAACSVAEASVAVLQSAMRLPSFVGGNQPGSVQLQPHAGDVRSRGTTNISTATTGTTAPAPAHAPNMARTAAAARKAPAAADSLLPALFLFGRCCLQMQTVHNLQNASRLTVPTQGMLGCLQYPALAQSLTAAGHDTQHMQDLLQGLLALLHPAQDNTSNIDARASEQSSSAAAASQLQSVGRALTSVAVRCVCNNPTCSNADGRSEMGLVSGHSCICAGCRTARYCGRICQRQAWKQHKPVCKALAAAGASSGS
jgi:hypothetical protein